MERLGFTSFVLIRFHISNSYILAAVYYCEPNTDSLDRGLGLNNDCLLTAQL
jgi:hypothetical protein